jgi:hypothetical protein
MQTYRYGKGFQVKKTRTNERDAEFVVTTSDDKLANSRMDIMTDLNAVFAKLEHLLEVGDSVEVSISVNGE